MLQLSSDGREFLLFLLLLDAHTLSTLYYFISQFAFVGGILLLLRVNLRRYLIPKFLLLLLHVLYRFASHTISRAPIHSLLGQEELLLQLDLPV